LSTAFRETAAAAGHEQAREAAEHLAEVFSKDRYVATNERRRTRRQAIANRLRELDEVDDSAEVADLE
jgi:predicted ArsR family transcriptional regulator